MASKLSKAVFDKAAASVGQSEPMTAEEFVYELYDSAANDLGVPNPLPPVVKAAVWWSRLKSKRVMIPSVGDVFFIGDKSGNMRCGIIGGVFLTNIICIEPSEKNKAVITEVHCLADCKGYLRL